MKYTAIIFLSFFLALSTVTVLPSHCVEADYTLFSDSFDDGNWTESPKWEYVLNSSPITVSESMSTSQPYSLRVASNNETGAVRTFSGLSSASQKYTCTFKLYIESLVDEAIPWCLQPTSGATVVIIYAFPNGRIKLGVRQTSGTEITAEASTSLSYGQWHSVRITYDGSVTSLYLDNHTQPDASITQAYTSIPAKICIGNFYSPHTSTFHIDDLLITAPEAPEPAKVYVQMCSDTSTDGISISYLRASFPANDYSYTSPTGQAAQVMSESFRTSHRDSLGNPMKLTWYMLCGSLYAYGMNTGPLLPFELMQDNHGASIERWGDELAYHYHTWIWSDLDLDGVYHWNQAPNFTYCLSNFESTVAHLILDRDFYPSSFRSGWHYMDNDFQNCLDDWFPFRFENDHPNVRSDTTEPVDNVYDWSRSPSTWIPYHPDPQDYQSPGNLRGWESRSRYITSTSRQQIDDMFVQALSGTTQVVTLFSHLKESDFPSQLDRIHGMLSDAHAGLPQVHFEYLTGRECMKRWLDHSDDISPEISISSSDNGDERTAIITVNETIYQKEPFVARWSEDGAFSRIPCTILGQNRWSVQYSKSTTNRIAAAVTDWSGNAAVKSLPLPVRIFSLTASASTTSAQITWRTSCPSITKLEYRLPPSGSSTIVVDNDLSFTHKVTLNGLLPSRIYGIKAYAADNLGTWVRSQEIGVMTTSAKTIIIDNIDQGFSVTGNWSTGNIASGRYGADYRYASTSLSGTSSAVWSWQAPASGVYKACAWWSAGSNRSISALYTVTAGGQQYTRVMDQQLNGGMWNTLAVFHASAGDTLSVSLSNLAPSGFVVIADAVRFEKVTAVPNPTVTHLLPDGADVHITDAFVTAVFAGSFYIQGNDRTPGLRVEGTGVSEGDNVGVTGTLSTRNGERVITGVMVDRQLNPITNKKP